MTNRSLLFLFLMTLVFAATAQPTSEAHSSEESQIDNVLSQILLSNKAIIANKQYWEAEKLQYKTGLTLKNPTVEYDNLLNFPGGLQDLYIIQTFDFPTTYSRKVQVANQMIEYADIQSAIYTQELLLEAKLICIELIYINKKKLELKLRTENAEKLFNAIQVKRDNGAANSLEVNKAKLQMLDLQNDLRITTSRYEQLINKLAGLNGGELISFQDVSYPIVPLVPDFQTLAGDIQLNDYEIKSTQQEKIIHQKQINLSKSLALPKIQGGYYLHSESNINYNGIHLGMSIPLFENKNTVKLEQARVLFSELQLEHHKNKLHYEIKQLYEKYLILKTSLEEYRQIFATLNNEMLKKALDAGEISLIEYYLELRFFYASYDTYLELERDFHKVIAELYKYQL